MRADVDSVDVARELLRRRDGSLVPSNLAGSPPSFLLPVDRRVAAAMCRAHNGLRSTRRRLQRNIVGGLIGAGLARTVTHPLSDSDQLRILHDGALIDALEDRLGTVPEIGIGLGKMDGFWKPVMHLFDKRTRRSIGFAKVGWTPITRSLVENEGAVLSELDGGLDDLLCPRPLHRFDSGDLKVLITEPLPQDVRRITDLPPPPLSVVAASAEPTELTTSAWWTELRGHVDGATYELSSQHDLVLADLFDEIDAHLEGCFIPFGTMHGDWVPWNLGRRRDGRLVAWDWEYGRRPAPVGLDMVHGRYQAVRLLDAQNAREAFRVAHRDADPTIALAHAAMIVARRCWISSCGVTTTDPTCELDAGIDLIRAVLTRDGGRR